MKVIFVTREGCRLSGARVRCYNLASALGALGMNAEVFSTADHLGAACGEKELEMSWAAKSRLALRSWKYFEKQSRDAVIVLQRVNYHVLAPLLAAGLKRQRVILDLDDWNMRENPVYYGGFYPSSKMEFAVRKIASSACGCVAASRFLETYLQAFNRRVLYLPTGVDTSLFQPRLNGGSSKVVFSWVGTAYHPEMGDCLRFLLDCFGRVAAQCQDVELRMAGEGKYYEQIRQEIRRHQYRERIFVLDWLNPHAIPEHMAGIDIGLLPLIQATKFNRSKSPTKLFEYMSMAKPVVASRIGEAERVITSGRQGFLAGDKDEFADHMLTLARDGQLRERMGQEARLSIEQNYSLTVLAPKMAEFIRGL